MTPSELRKIVARGETETLELKATMPAQQTIAKHVCGFLNAQGGRLLIGVAEQGHVVGLHNAERVAEELRHDLMAAISPPALWTVERVEVGDEEIVLIQVPEGMDKPYVVDGAIHLRRGGATVPASRSEISALILKRASASERWERQTVIGADLSDLDEQLICETARVGVESGAWQGDPEKAESFLVSLGLTSNGAVTNAAVLLFGKQTTRFLPQARSRLVVMPEGKAGGRYSLDRTFDACLLKVTEKIAEVLRLYAGGVESEFTDKTWPRQDRPLYPMTALREGVMNALVHRDYALAGTVNITLSPGSLQISNPGSLPEGLSAADLKRDHLSIPRNPDVAHVCFLRKLIEKIGRGTQRIIEDCRRANLREPKWVTGKLETTLTFYAGSTRRGQTRVEELNDRQRAILERLGIGTSLRAADVSKLVSGRVSDRTLRTDLQVLVEGGWLERRGRGRSSSYVRTGKGEAH